MSRVGKKPIALPQGVTVTVDGGRVRVQGPGGDLSMAVIAGTSVVVEPGVARVEAGRPERNPGFGTMRAQLNNMVTGVSAGFRKVLEITGTGYRAALDGGKLVLQLGFSHPVVFEPPDGIKIQLESPTRVVVSGADKALVGQVAADIRDFRPPEPYKGKGIRYEGEHVRRKAGKAAGTGS